MDGDRTGSESLYRALVEHSPAGIFEAALDGRLTFWSDTWLRMVGVPAGEHREHYLDMVHPEDRAGVVEAWTSAIRGRREATLEFRYLHADERVVWVQTQVGPVADAAGEVTGFVGVAVDITERRTAEESLQAERERLAEAQAVGSIGSFSLDLLTGAIEWSDEQFRVHGYHPMASAPSLGEQIEHVHPDDRAEARATLAMLESDPRDFALDYRVVGLDGRTRHVNTAGVVRHDADGRPVRVTGTSRDVTGDREHEAELRRAESRFRMLYEEAPIGTCIIGLDRRLVDVNDAFCELVGRPREELVGTHDNDLTHPADRGVGAQIRNEILAGNVAVHRREKRIVRPDGGVVWIEVHVVPLLDAAGAPESLLCQAEDVTARRRYEERLRDLVDRDALTGLLTRRAFEEAVTRHREVVGSGGAVLVLDVDHFKYINDGFGHGVGDQMIERVGATLAGRARDTDVLARFGGDEFAVFLPGASAPAAQRMGEALLDEVRQMVTPSSVGHPRRLTASLGVAVFAAGEDVSAADVLVDADLAMYDAKREGRNRMTFHRPQAHPEDTMRGRMHFSERIRDALDEDRFTLLAQPIVDLATGRPARFELLLRMVEGKELIPPGGFLHVAEEIDLIQEIDRWVVSRAIGELAAWRDRVDELVFHVNLSGKSVGDPTLLALIESRLRETGAPPDGLVFEITETAAVADIARAQGFADRLGALGARLALDDFGAGFGSFYYLKHLPFDVLKIDGEFVRGCSHDEMDRLVIGSLVEIAAGLHKTTVAEFIEDEETVAALRRLGADLGQGFHLGRPAPLARWLGEGALSPVPGR